MRRLIFIPLACLLAGLCSSQATAQALAQFCCVDDPELSAGLERAISLDMPDDTAPWQRARTASERARRYLRAQGYFAATVVPALGAAQNPVLRIETGDRFTYGTISVDVGADVQARERVREALTLEPGEAYDAGLLLSVELAALERLRASGWPEASLGERAITVDHARQEVDVVLRYLPGIYSRLGEIRLHSEAWNADFILGLSPLEDAAAVSADGLRTYRNRLLSLQSVSAVQLSLGEPDGEGPRELGITLEHAPRHVAEVALSYSTSDGGGATASLNRRNLLGEDQLFTFQAQLQTLSQGVEASLSFPHWRRYGRTLLLSAGLQSEETDAYDQQELTAGFNLSRALREQLQYAVGAELDFSRVTNPEGVSDAISVQAGLVLTLDARDDPLEPTRGYRARGEMVPTATIGDTNGQYVRLEASGSAYWRASESWVVAARGRIGSLVGAPIDDIPADQRFYAGGGGSVRGFDYQGLGPQTAEGLPSGGLSVAEAGLELRWRDTSRWGGVVFVEAGTSGDDLLPAVDDMRAAFGVGARYYLDFAPVRIDLATPLDRRDGETPVHLYFSIGQAF